MTVILTFCSALVTYHLSKGLFIVGTEEGGVYNIPTSVKIIFHGDNLHQEDIILTFKTAMTSILITLEQYIIARDVYEKYVSNFDHKHHD